MHTADYFRASGVSDVLSSLRDAVSDTSQHWSNGRVLIAFLANFEQTECARIT